ncbi:MAG: ATP-binding protein [Armatimonadota bacterium]|nr:ATP-binding protein [Armatimonadota bacterium]MDR7463553.1 ATP-binding protein [Armatimonadota bacterium]MDR7470618.1 ATP-binding protein [Armatimonadota bacterium]MDR7473865.1 ATP-binding protein [Armatimonadota bacterium]MDR7539076.1 ATP-binding protein [Armatimonadota bacterium]
MPIREIIRKLIEERQAEGAPAAVEEPEVRLAIYDSPLTAPRIVSLSGDDFETLIGELAAQTYNYSHERGGRIPFVVIREVVENLIHAYFHNAVITILDDGNTIRISDQGPGIRDKQRALQPGFTTATREMRRYIRGVGSGLPVAKEQLAFLGGTLGIEDNLDRGTVITLSLSRPPAPGADSPPRRDPRPQLTPRQKKVLLLIGELGAAGPTTIAKELDISHSTAYRDLRVLEHLKLVQDKGSGKRTLTEEGIIYLDEVFAP